MILALGQAAWPALPAGILMACAGHPGRAFFRGIIRP
jgi:hypothetical protein